MDVVAGTTLFAPDIEITPSVGQTVVGVLYYWYETPQGQSEELAGRDRIFTPTRAGTCRYEVLALQSDGDEAMAFGPTITVAAADTVAPVLSALSGTPQDGAAALAWSTDSAGGTFYWTIDQTATRSATEIKGGIGALSDTLEHTGIGAVANAGAQPAILATGLANGTTHYFHIVHEDTAGNLSAPHDVGVVPAAAGSGVVLAHIAATSIPSSAGTIEIPVTLQEGKHLLAVNLKGADTVTDVSVTGGTSVERMATAQNGSLLSVAVYEVDVPVGGASSVSVARAGTSYLPALVLGYRISGGAYQYGSGALNGSGNDTIDAALTTDPGDAILGFAFGSAHTSEMTIAAGWQGKEPSQYLDGIRAEAFFDGSASGGAPESFEVTAPTAFKPWILASFCYRAPTS